jgi:hypothetical protein
MLRIDETSKTLVAPEAAAFVPEPALARDELLTLLTAGWTAFAAEIGEPALRFVAAAPLAGVDVLAFDESAGRVALVAVDAGLAEVLTAAAAVSALHAEQLTAIHEVLAAAMPGASPRLLLVGDEPAADVVTTLDWLVRRHGLEATAHHVRALRFGSERLLDVARVYPPADPRADGPDFFAAVAPAAPDGAARPASGASAPPPGVVA